MNVEFQNSMTKMPVTEDIVVNGEKIGEIEPWQDRFHSKIHLPGYLCLIQGFGFSKEEAIQNAIRSGRLSGVELLSEINALEDKLLGKGKED
ncbi:MAG: hypothetical protein M1510_01550 [Nitrospirae bacterium]|nr:hypothetical protein [Nitrospirota bacterium]MCL5238624.1 hypothetical protein [Nitrospirota bacterium]